MDLPKVISSDDFFERCERLGFLLLPKGRSRERFVGNGKLRIRVPNSHGNEHEVKRSAVKHFLWEAGLTEEDWNAAADSDYKRPDDSGDDDGEPRRRVPRRER